MARIIKAKNILAGILLIPALCCHADDRESRLKAAFILNFAKFVEWPADAVSAPGQFNFCFIGIDRYQKSYIDALHDKKVKGRAVTVHILSYTSELDQCQVLFLSDLSQAQLAYVQSVIAGKAILTIGEDRQFMALGGMIRFFAYQGKMRFEINPDAAREAGLTISSKLLNLANIRSNSSGGKE